MSLPGTCFKRRAVTCPCSHRRDPDQSVLEGDAGFQQPGLLTPAAFGRIPRGQGRRLWPASSLLFRCREDTHGICVPRQSPLRYRSEWAGRFHPSLSTQSPWVTLWTIVFTTAFEAVIPAAPGGLVSFCSGPVKSKADRADSGVAPRAGDAPINTFARRSVVNLFSN